MAACVSPPVQKRGTFGLTPLRSPESLLAARRINVCWRSAVKTLSTRIRVLEASSIQTAGIASTLRVRQKMPTT